MFGRVNDWVKQTNRDIACDQIYNSIKHGIKSGQPILVGVGGGWLSVYYCFVEKICENYCYSGWLLNVSKYRLFLNC